VKIKQFLENEEKREKARLEELWPNEFLLYPVSKYQRRLARTEKAWKALRKINNRIFLLHHTKLKI